MFKTFLISIATALLAHNACTTDSLGDAKYKAAVARFNTAHGLRIAGECFTITQSEHVIFVGAGDGGLVFRITEAVGGAGVKR